MDINNNDKKYRVGYVPGVFDLFHIGHLNLIRKCKEQCEYLIVGVLIDELVMHYKGAIPYIPYEERASIVAALKEVDKVIAVDFNNTDKLDAWKQLKFDCHFSGNDHASDWEEVINKLREVGSDMKFFQYTLSTSSSLIKERLKKDFLFQYDYRTIVNREIILFGTGIYFDKYMEEYGVRFTPAFAVDNNSEKWGTKKKDIEIASPRILMDIPQDKLWLIICVKDTSDIEKQVKQMGIKDYRIFSHQCKIISLTDCTAIVKETGLSKDERVYLKQVQRVLMKLLLEFDRFCKKNNIKYYLICGSLLGAVRHQSLIPWDDDVDVALQRDDYEKMVKIAKKEWSKGDYLLLNYDEMGKGTFLDFMVRLVYMKEEIPVNIFKKVKGKGREDIQNHAALDIYILDQASDNERKHKWQTMAIQGIYGLAMGHRSVVDYSEYKNVNKKIQIIIKMLNCIGKFLPLKLIFYCYEMVRKMNMKNEGSDLFESNGWIFCIPWRFRKDWFEEGTEVYLDGNAVMAPRKYDEFLKMHYGDYMQLPSLEKRKPTHAVNSSGIYQ